MPLLNTITTPYAEAFLQVAEAREEVDQVVEQAKAVLALWHESAELRGAMARISRAAGGHGFSGS
jgi:F-type H+-transporting ATPase subunit delta